MGQSLKVGEAGYEITEGVYENIDEDLDYIWTS